MVGKVKSLGAYSLNSPTPRDSFDDVVSIKIIYSLVVWSSIIIFPTYYYNHDLFLLCRFHPVFRPPKPRISLYGH